MTTEENSKMNLKTKIVVFSSIFLAISIVHLFGVLFEESLAFYTKPWLIISLMLLYISQVTQSNKTYLFALMFSLIGDILLMYPQQFFVLGLFSFLIAHFCFIAIVFKNLKGLIKENIIKASLPFVFIFFFIDEFIVSKLK
ncbi:MAG: hypothetical protein HC798_04175 [Polaribacter sp.]|nr:hypothetical protein [Polaribacter sp.]